MAECILRIIANPSPRLRYAVGKNMVRNVGIRKFMLRLFEYALSHVLGLHRH